MSESIKDEFKDLISTLSTEICKEVLLEDIKNIKDSFEEMNENYLSLYDKYTSNVKDIEKQLEDLDANNSKLDEFISYVDDNNLKIEQALYFLKEGHREVIDDIINKNRDILLEYETKVRYFNDEERNKFITEFNTNLSLQNEKYVEGLKNYLDEEKINNMIVRTEQIADKLTLLDQNVTDTRKYIRNTEEKNAEDLTIKILDLENKLKDNMRYIDKNMRTISNDFNSQLSLIQKDLDNKNKTLTRLLGATLVVCIFLLFR